jgi:nucleoside-diphosphate-sugar epimerase
VKTLVTGAPGWLATRLVEVLSCGWDGKTKSDRQVRCLVLRGVDPSPISRFPIEIVEGNVCNKSSLKNAARGADTIFHAVGIIHPRRIQELCDINTEGTRNILSAATEAGVKRFIFVSSNSVTGCNSNRNKLFTESDPPNPYMAYGRSKYQAERIVKEFNERGKIETVVIRPCWYYGPNQPTRQTRFFEMIKAGNPIIFGDGKNLRSMSYIDNVVQGLLLAERSEKANGQTYWIADKRPYETIEIYRTVAEILGVKDFRPRFAPSLASELCKCIDAALQFVGLYYTDFHVVGEMNKDIACSIEKAEKALGYRPTIELREGMEKSIEWCRKNGASI